MTARSAPQVVSSRIRERQTAASTASMPNTRPRRRGQAPKPHRGAPKAQGLTAAIAVAGPSPVPSIAPDDPVSLNSTGADVPMAFATLRIYTSLTDTTSAGMLSLLSEAHRIVHGSRESDPSLCHGAALVAAATLVGDPLHPSHGAFRAGLNRAYQRRHTIGIIGAGNEVAQVNQFRPRCRVHSVRHRGGLFRTRQKFPQT